MLPYLLSKAGPLPAIHPTNATIFEPGTIYVAPPDRHMLIQKGYVRLFGSLIEEANLAKRLRTEPLFAEDSYTAASLDDRVGSLGSQANQVSEWLHAMSGLVEPEPSMNGPSAG